MLRILLASVLGLITLGSTLFVITPEARAANAVCVASPSAGPVGTTFSLTAPGFTPNTHLWTYAVDPSGAAFSDPANQAFGGGVKSDASGTASFPFVTRFVEQDTGTVIARALGTWTLVVQELGLDRTVVHEAHCTVNITSSNAPLSGAALSVNPPQGFQDELFVVTGVGFAPGEVVNSWLTPPPNCDAFAYNLGGVTTFNSAANAFSYTSATADASGTISFPIFPSTPSFCVGEWTVSVRALGSGRGASAAFVITGHVVTPNGAILTVNPTVALSRGGQLTFSGSGYVPNEVVNCWYTRPEGNVRELPNLKADGAGDINFTYTTGFDGTSGMGEGMSYSEGAVGTYHMTCKGVISGRLAITEFTLIGGITDP